MSLTGTQGGRYGDSHKSPRNKRQPSCSSQSTLGSSIYDSKIVKTAHAEKLLRSPSPAHDPFHPKYNVIITSNNTSQKRYLCCFCVKQIPPSSHHHRNIPSQLKISSQTIPSAQAPGQASSRCSLTIFIPPTSNPPLSPPSFGHVMSEISAT
ncbi:hypothetical protein VTJ04DRAFT_8131 [Mycothermus thermophilus]|uniref:uncharacterized protein n=1 Tax=Humicola insolens TaxID=85995 RepID=UPI0037447CD6